MDTENKKYRIGLWGSIIFIVAAILFDVLTLIPLVGSFLGWIFWIGASIYLWKTKHGLANWKTLVPKILSVVGELIPGIQSLPTIITATIIIIVISRMEDKTGIKLMPTPNKKIPGITPPRLNRSPLNNRGIRYPNNN